MGRFRDARVKPPFGTQLDFTHDHNRDLVAAFLLNEEWDGSDDGDNSEGGRTLDYSRYSNHIREEAAGIHPLIGGSPYGVVKHYSSASLRLITPAVTHYDIADNPFTMEALVCPVQFSNSFGVGSVLAYYGGGFTTLGGVADSEGYMLGVVPTGGTTGRLFARVGSTAGTFPPLTMTIDGRTWTHIAMTWDGANIRRYVNGSLIPLLTAKASFTTTSGQSLVVGNIQTGALTRADFQGKIAHARLWIGRALDEHTLRQMSEDPYQAWEQSIFYFLVPDLSLPRVTQSLQLRGNIRNTADQDLQLRGNIRATNAQSLQMRARVSHTVTTSFTMRATIEVPQSDLDGILDTWSVSDEFDTFSRQFSARASSVDCLQVGNEVEINAGYDSSRVRVIKGIIDRVSKSRTADKKSFQVTGRDAGAKELDSFRITKTWKSEPTKTMPRAHQIIREVAGFMGLTVGNLDFPDYDLYNSYISIGKRGLDIVAELAEPWNQFARVQYIPQIRNRVLSVVKIDWASVPEDGYSIGRRQHSQQDLQQELYLDQPRLNEVQQIVIRGAAYLRPICELGTQTRTEYFRNIATVEVNEAIAGQVTAPGETVVKDANPAVTKEVTTETTTVETVYCDKVINRVETIYVDDELTSRTTERFWYYEPGTIQSLIPADVDTFIVQSASPSEDALLYMAHTKREGFADRGGVAQFLEIFRETTQYYYDGEEQVACEKTTTQEYDEDLGTWGITKHASRTHSQLTGATVRTTLQSFIFEDSKYKLSSADVQNVGGVRPSVSQPSSRKNVQTIQAQAPQGEIDADGEPIDPGESLYTWTYENPYIGQEVCDTLYALALEEQEFQLSGAKWEIINFQGILNPNINVGRPVIIEREDGTSRNYWVENVDHTYGANFAGTTGTAKRITTEDIS